MTDKYLMLNDIKCSLEVILLAVERAIGRAYSVGLPSLKRTRWQCYVGIQIFE